jgi:hypothetical protein
VTVDGDDEVKAVAASDSHCRVATTRRDPCEIARVGGAVMLR